MRTATRTEPDPEHGREAAAAPAQSARWLWIGAGVLVAALAAGALPKIRAHSRLKVETDRLAIPVVSVATPQKRTATRAIVLPASLQAWSEASIYARASGYLKGWYTDIGAHVSKGDLLAEIDSPEIDQQLRQARADLELADANLRLADVTSARYRDLLKTDSVSKQDADNAAGDSAAKRAMRQAAEANVKRLSDLQTFERVYAPFDGVVTSRNVDVGALIEAGSGSSGRELFRVAQTTKLRAYVKVPQASTVDAKPGMPATLTLSEMPGKTFSGSLLSTANAIDPVSRTLLAEFEVPNPDGALLPGAYASLKLEIPLDKASFLVPVDALLFRAEGLRVATVGGGGKITLKAIDLGRDLGKEVEVVGGLDGSERIVLSPPDSTADGDVVRPAAPDKDVKPPADAQPAHP